MTGAVDRGGNGADEAPTGGETGLARAFERLFDLAPEERRHLDALTARTQEVEARRKLVFEGRPSREIHVVKEGWLAESVQLRDGQRQILSFRLPGDLIGIEGLAYPSALHTTFALTRCTVAPLTMEAFESMQRRFPRLSAALFLMTLRESAILHDWEVNLGRRVALPRVAHLLLELDYRVRRRGLADGKEIPFPLTQEDVADATGLTVSYVNRVLQRLRRDGLIRLSERSLAVVEREALVQAAGFRPDYIDRWGQGGSRISGGA